MNQEKNEDEINLKILAQNLEEFRAEFQKYREEVKEKESRNEQKIKLIFQEIPEIKIQLDEIRSLAHQAISISYKGRKETNFQLLLEARLNHLTAKVESLSRQQNEFV